MKEKMWKLTKPEKRKIPEKIRTLPIREEKNQTQLRLKCIRLHFGKSVKQLDTMYFFENPFFG